MWPGVLPWMSGAICSGDSRLIRSAVPRCRFCPRHALLVPAAPVLLFWARADFAAVHSGPQGPAPLAPPPNADSRQPWGCRVHCSQQHPATDSLVQRTGPVAYFVGRTLRAFLWILRTCPGVALFSLVPGRCALKYCQVLCLRTRRVTGPFFSQRFSKGMVTPQLLVWIKTNSGSTKAAGRAALGYALSSLEAIGIAADIRDRVTVSRPGFFRGRRPNLRIRPMKTPANRRRAREGRSSVRSGSCSDFPHTGPLRQAAGRRSPMRAHQRRAMCAPSTDKPGAADDTSTRSSRRNRNTSAHLAWFRPGYGRSFAAIMR